jgi:hypothetical protein
MKYILILTMLFSSSAFTSAVDITKKLANEGNVAAQYSLGVMYEVGDGVPKKPTLAFMWFEEAAHQGYFKAQYKIAGMYRNGIGVTQDYDEAVKWYKKAADQGDGMLTNHKLKREKPNADETNWLAVLAGAALIGYAEDKDKKKKQSSTSYDFSKTQGMSSSELGKELLRQKRNKGISGKGIAVPYEQPSIGYDPSAPSSIKIKRLSTKRSDDTPPPISEKSKVTSAYILPSSQTSNFCHYRSRGKEIAVSKRNSWALCPNNINLPSDSGSYFDVDQMGQSTGNRKTLNYGKSATSADYCYYSNNVQIPKSSYGPCPQMIEY